jgi:hypothetical protein
MTCTSSLAQWFSADDGLPEPDTIEAPAVLVTPNSVVVHGINPAVLVLNTAEEILAFLGDDCELVAENIGIEELANLAWQLPRLVMACSHTDETEEELYFRTEEGITVERLEPGVMAFGTITDTTVKVHLPSVLAWQLVAEITALMVRRIAHNATLADRLNTALQASA